MAPQIRVLTDGKSATFVAPGTARIGRSPDCDVVVSNATVSRYHAELRHQDGSWHLVDVGSRHGVHVDGRRVVDQPLTGCTEARIGHTAIGEMVRLEPVTEEPGTEDEAAPPEVPAPRGLDPSDPLFETRLPPRRRSRWPTLTATLGGADRRFTRGPVRVGREPGYELVCADPAVSRLHAELEPRRDGWRYVDRSRGGTYRKGRRVRTVMVRERVELRLGDPVQGPVLALAPEPGPAVLAGLARRRRRRLGLVALAVVLALTAATAGLFVLLRGVDGAGLGEAALDRAKSATVRLEVPGGNMGSGSLISSDGLVLTNAHVARPQAPGVAALYQERLAYATPPFLTVALTDPETDMPAEPRYRARVLAVDGYLDVAVLRIFARADGSPLPGPLDLPAVPLGSAETVRTGDDVTLLGFPGIAESDAVSVTRGLVSTFTPDPRIGPRAEIDTDARSAPGNSGGLAIDNDGNLIGLPFRGRPDADQPVQSNRIRPVDLARPLVALAGRGEGATYVSPYVTPLRGDESASFRGLAARPDTSCRTIEAQVASPVYAVFGLSGVPRGLDVGVGVGYPAVDQSRSLSWRWAEGPRGCVAVAVDADLLVADPVPVEVRAGPRLATLAAVTLQPSDLAATGLGLRPDLGTG